LCQSERAVGRFAAQSSRASTRNRSAPHPNPRLAHGCADRALRFEPDQEYMNMKHETHIIIKIFFHSCCANPSVLTTLLPKWLPFLALAVSIMRARFSLVRRAFLSEHWCTSSVWNAGGFLVCFLLETGLSRLDVLQLFLGDVFTPRLAGDWWHHARCSSSSAARVSIALSY
jgi:hypothetical protein